MTMATVEELFPIVQETKIISPKGLKGKTIRIRALTKGDFRRMKEFADAHPENPTLVDAWVLKTVIVEPDLSQFTPEEIQEKMDKGYLVNTLDITKEVLEFSRVSEAEIEKLKNLAELQKA